jgi:ABC-type branched-subunit amino acid transport system ATPase component
MAAALEISNLHAWYGESHILHDVNLSVQTGEVVTLLGRNGAGRTTTLRAIMGLTGARRGSIKVNGVEAIGLPTYKVAHLGIGYCPEERGIFSSLSAGHVRAGDLYDVSQSAGAQAQPRHAPLRRRTADAGSGPHSAHRRAPVAAR